MAKLLLNFLMSLQLLGKNLLLYIEKQAIDKFLNEFYFLDKKFALA